MDINVTYSNGTNKTFNSFDNITDNIIRTSKSFISPIRIFHSNCHNFV